MISQREYWDQVEQDLDTYYREEKAVLRRAVDKLFRKAMAERFCLTLRECNNIKGKSVLDIGCGTGRMAVQLAKKGAYVVGIDFSPIMIHRASDIAEKEGLDDKCTFIRGDFAKHVFKQRFDISVALGFFDYTPDAPFNIKKIKFLTKEKCITSFSARFAFQVPLRIIWLRSKNRPAYFYTKKQLKRLLSPHFSRYKIKNISAGYHCVAHV